MNPVTAVVSQWAEKRFGDQRIEISEEEGRATCQFTAGTKGDSEYSGYVEVYEDLPGVLLYMYVPADIPEQSRPAVSELLVRVNFGLMTGTIGMSVEKGSLRYEGGVNVKDGVLSLAMIDGLVDRGIECLDKYVPAILEVVYGRQSPAKAYEALSKDKSDQPGGEPLPEELDEAAIIAWKDIAGNEGVLNFV